MSATASSFTSAADGTEIATTAWVDAGDSPKGSVQIAHGLAEHAARYDRFARALNQAGFRAFAGDHRGHGRTAENSGHGLGDFGDVGFDGLIADVVQFGRWIGESYADTPVFLLGHSMGSFAAQTAILDHSDVWSGVILSGSTALDVMAAGLAEAEGPVGLEAFNTGFEHRTGFEWLSRDEAEVDAYVADPWCGFEAPPETIPLLFGGAARVADPEALSRIRSDLPLLIASGSDDPLAGGGQLITVLAERYRAAGIDDVTVTVYPGARHEILNETNRGEVTADIIGWLTSHC